MSEVQGKNTEMQLAVALKVWYSYLQCSHVTPLKVLESVSPCSATPTGAILGTAISTHLIAELAFALSKRAKIFLYSRMAGLPTRPSSPNVYALTTVKS